MRSGWFELDFSFFGPGLTGLLCPLGTLLTISKGFQGFFPRLLSTRLG